MIKRSAGLVIICEGKVLLVKPKNSGRDDLWSIPKGLIDPGENMIQAAVRETYEETGIRIPIGRIDRAKRSLITYVDHRGQATKLIFYFIVHIRNEELSQLQEKDIDNAEIEEMKLCTIREAQKCIYWKQLPVLNHLSEGRFNLTDLDNHLRLGYLMKIKHPKFPVWIYNITPACKAARCWNYTTLSCRGLVLDDSGHVVARPFAKFFSREEYYPEIIEMLPEQFTDTDKIDGALGICFFYHNEPVVCIKNTFGHYLETVASDIIVSRFASISQADPKFTYLFEIVAARNPFTISYYRTELFFIAAIDNRTGNQMNDALLPGFTSTILQDKNQLPSLREGVVRRYSDGTLVKIKQDAFFRAYQRIKHIRKKLVEESETDDWINSLSFMEKDMIIHFKENMVVQAFRRYSLSGHNNWANYLSDSFVYWL